MDIPLQIKKLDEDVINKIAAGEVIQRPANALKEMIENSLDAQATNIQIRVREGGLKLIQIQDDGVGISKDDFKIVCERFTTSKLKEFNDLQSINTYGFRGEALASISHVAHLCIISKTANELCAYKANFIDGKINDKPKPLAGNQGTIITVEDLFYNMHIRRRALKSPAEEYQKIHDIVCKYAVHNSKVGFLLKKNDVIDVKTQIKSNCQDNIQIIYGSNIAKELIEINYKNELHQFNISGYSTNLNYSGKKLIFLLFINDRLVDCPTLKRSLDQIYSNYLPKNNHPFIYLNLKLNPINIDVNVHPTKHQVHFLDEENIIELIGEYLQQILLNSNKSKTFLIQHTLPSNFINTLPIKDCSDNEENSKISNKSTYPQNFVRTDAKEQKLDKFFGTPSREIKMSLKKVEIDEIEENEKIEKLINNNNCINENEENVEKSDEDIFMDTTKDNEKSTICQKLLSQIYRVETKLLSVNTIRKSIENNCHQILREVFAQHVYVGSINPQKALIQYSTKLYLCNTDKLMEELFYQLIMFNFQNFNCMKLSEKLPIYDLVLNGLNLPEVEWSPEDGDKMELAMKIKNVLINKSDMLSDYFSLDIDKDGNLLTIPILLNNYMPDVCELPLYLIRLATEVQWETEIECFDTFARETAIFYSKINEDTCWSENNWEWIVEYVFYGALKEYFIPPKQLAQHNGVIIEIANLPNLYRVFERC